MNKNSFQELSRASTCFTSKNTNFVSVTPVMSFLYYNEKNLSSMRFYPNLNLSSLSRFLIANAFCISYLFANIMYTKNLLDWILNFLHVCLKLRSVICSTKIHKTN